MQNVRGSKPSLDEQLETVANGQRRRLLLALLEENPQGELAGRSNNRATDVGDDRIAMQHCHLPKLESRGFVGWDRETRQVVKGPEFGEIKPLLKLIEDYRDELPEA